ncbi:hypothetical protein [Streptomyces sp. H27-S2]|uniref:hypothetical protein n=1 Tax=Streptomyces antarcticus TaxID=2996458 RepID=UPI0022717313|nr:hypothetical protein [Streptomyces sp. H27-S2]MCY0950454.1 hypothetical protein [Streptomyces sp. H27-S2]
MTLGLWAAPPAQAHPLGNFSVNHYDGLRLTPDHIEDTTVVDTAEIPTAQDHEATDNDHDEQTSLAEAAARATHRCAELARRTHATVDESPLTWHSTRSTLTYATGAAGLPIARLTCALRAPAPLSETAAVSFTSGAEAARTGWKEITATGSGGLRITTSSVPTTSVSGALRTYPAKAESRPLNTTTAELRTEPGSTGAVGDGAAGPGAVPNALAREPVLFPALENRLTNLTTGRDLTLALRQWEPYGTLLTALAVLFVGVGLTLRNLFPL